METTQATIFSIMAVRVPLCIFLFTQICKSCGSLKRAFLWDVFIARNTKEVFKVFRGCKHKVLAGYSDQKGNVIWFSGGDSSDSSGGAGEGRVGGSESYSGLQVSKLGGKQPSRRRKKGSSLSIRSYNLSLSARVALAEPPTSKVCNNSDKGPSFPLKSIISSTDFPRLNSVSNGFMRISAQFDSLKIFSIYAFSCYAKPPGLLGSGFGWFLD